MNPLNIFSSNQLVHALGWTLLHSIWQIAIIGVLLAILLVFMKKSSSSERYYTAIASMLLAVAVSIFTFATEYTGYQKNTSFTQELQLSPVEMEFAKEVIKEAGETWQSSFINNFESYFERNLPLIVLVWNLVVLLLLLRTIGGLAYSQRIKTYRTFAVSTKHEIMLQQLVKKLGIKRSIRILESAIIKVPIVAGYFKPVILIPLGVVSGLSVDQVEAVLAHELAHIKRNDYLVNIFQSIIEVLFFYHPAIWWISKNIRHERENACDDMALKVGINRKALATALTNLEVLNHEKSLLALAFSGNKTSLLSRVKRILNPQKTEVTMKDGFITILVVLASLTVMSFSMVSIIKLNKSNKEPVYKTKQISTLKHDNTKEKTVYNVENEKTAAVYQEENKSIIKDTIITINNRDNIIYQIEGVSYRLDFDKDAKISKFSVKGKEIPKGQWKNYEKIITEATAYFNFVNEDFDKQKFELQRQKAELEKQEAELLAQQKDIELYEKQRQEVEMALFERKKQEMEWQLEELKAQKDKMKSSDKEMKVLEEKIALQEMKMNQHEEEILAKQFDSQKQREQEKMKREYEMQRKKYEIDRKQHEGQMKINQKEQQILEEIVEEMKKDGLIDKNAISYKVNFSENELIINGKKQSAKFFKKYKQLLEKKARGKYGLKAEINVNPNYYGKTKEEVLKIQLAELTRHMDELVARTEELDKLSVELNLKMEQVEKEKLSDAEKKKIHELLTKKHQKILQEQKELQFKQQQLEIEYEKLIVN